MKIVHGIHLPDYDSHFSEHLDKELERLGAPGYQTKKWRAALPLVKRLRHAIDVGAHVGLWTMPMTKAFERVTAFEPMQDLAECWLKNCAGFGDAVVLNQVALGDRSGTIGIQPVRDNSGNAHVSDAGEQVSLCMLDEYEFEPVDFIKIDVEGYEAAVIRGGERTIRTHQPVMVVEQKPGNGSRYGTSDLEAVDLLTSWGAEIAWERAGDFAMIWR